MVALSLSVCLSCVWTILLNRDTGRVVHSWEQPKNIEYMDSARYTLYVREKGSRRGIYLAGTETPSRDFHRLER